MFLFSSILTMTRISQEARTFVYSSIKSKPVTFNLAPSFLGLNKRRRHLSSQSSSQSSTWLHPVIQNARTRPTSAHFQIDRDHLWHPYTSLMSPPPVLPISHAEGVTLYLEDSTPLLDAMSSWWCTIWGYKHPTLNSAVTAQLNKVSHVMFGGLTHRPAVELSDMLRHMVVR